jgi:exopolysaccharide biosynthesis polyprenyl glycosylphosphotransferase
VALTIAGDVAGGALIGVLSATLAPALPVVGSTIAAGVAAPVLLHLSGMTRAVARPGLRGQALAAARAGGGLTLVLCALAAVRGVPGGATLLALTAAAPVAAAVWLALRSLILEGVTSRLRARGRRRLLVVGADRGAAAVRAAFRAAGHDDEVVGHAGGGDLLAIGPREHLGGLDDVPAICRDGDVDRVLVVRPDLSLESLLTLGVELARDGREAHLVSDAFAPIADLVPLGRLDGRPVYVARETPIAGVGALAKRGLDVVGALLGIVFLAPIFLAIAVAITATSPGPVLFRQTRVGREGQCFEFLKFRSMKTGASADRHQAYVTRLMTEGHAAGQSAAGKKVFKLVDDPRVTSVGRFIRRTSLDELPQLWNVIRGEMSLVGPRPCVPYEWDLYKDWYRHRVDVTPGCTGLWQVVGRSAVDIDGMMLLDLHYASHWSLAGDLRLILATVPVMVFSRGAH